MLSVWLGCLKRRWHCLRRLRMAPNKACNIFVVCAILHNRARFLRLPDPDEPNMDGEAERDQPDVVQDYLPAAAAPQAPERMVQARARAVRDILIIQFF